MYFDPQGVHVRDVSSADGFFERTCVPADRDYTVASAS